MVGEQDDFAQLAVIPFFDGRCSPCATLKKNTDRHRHAERADADIHSTVPDGVVRNFIHENRQSVTHDLPRLNTTERFEIRENPENKRNALIWVIDQRIAEVRRKTGTVSKRAAVALTTQVAA